MPPLMRDGDRMTGCANKAPGVGETGLFFEIWAFHGNQPALWCQKKMSHLKQFWKLEDRT